MRILVLNAGSSSQKSCLYNLAEETLPLHPPVPLWESLIDWTHQAGVAEIKVKTAHGAEVRQSIRSNNRADVAAKMLETLWQGETQVIDQPSDIDGVGHRVVHGGEEYRESIRITPEVKEAIARLSTFAPIHNPVNLEGIEAMEQILGAEVPQVAVFDTAFHATLPPAAFIYPGPYDWVNQGIRRYGFHGISHAYCTQRATQLFNSSSDLRLINCHLGNGCSLAAVHNGRCVDTTMGFTPLDGLMMGTRSGAVDPGILIHLLRHEGYTADQLDQTLNKSSGLLGISGVSADLRQIMEAMEQGNERAQIAFDLFIHRLRAEIGSMLASLGGLDALIFTAGIGENSAPVRAATCQAFEFLGLRLDAEKNNNRPVDQDISTPDSTIRVLVIHTQEDWAIAQDCWKLLRGRSS